MRGCSLVRSVLSHVSIVLVRIRCANDRLTSLCLSTQYRIRIVQLPALIEAPLACDTKTPTINKTAFRTSKLHIGIIYSVDKLTSISSVPVPLIIRPSINSNRCRPSRGVTQNSQESYREKLPTSPENIYRGFSSF